MKSCGKVVFNTLELCQKRANELNQINEENRAAHTLRPYQCQDCNRYHLTSKKGNRSTEKKTPFARTKAAEYKFIKEETAFFEKKYKLNEVPKRGLTKKQRRK